jgi:hypothetical protein
MPLQDGITASNSSPQEVHQEVEQGAVGPNINMLYEMIQKTQTELAEITKHVKKTKTTDEGLQHKPLPEKNHHEKENNEGEKTLHERDPNWRLQQYGFPEGNTNSPICHAEMIKRLKLMLLKVYNTLPLRRKVKRRCREAPEGNPRNLSRFRMLLTEKE